LNVPRYGQNAMLEVIEVLYPGVVYLAKYIPGSRIDTPDLEGLGSSPLVVKVIYSGIAAEGYGDTIHQHLAMHDMAPKYFFSFDVKLASLPNDLVPIESHHVMEYLPPPSNESPGWISLLELEEQFPKVASMSKEEIKNALFNVIHVLREKNFVHADFRPNNLLIFVQIITGPDGKTCVIQKRPSDPSLPYLKVIDFDWAGVADHAIYPLNRNPDVLWPGKDGMPISLDDDKKMIKSWMEHWPSQVLVPVSVPDMVERGEETVTLQIRRV